MEERNPPIVIYADIRVSSFLAVVLVKYTLSTLHIVFICATAFSFHLRLKISSGHLIFKAGILEHCFPEIKYDWFSLGRSCVRHSQPGFHSC
jgi:hypothetical protein